MPNPSRETKDSGANGDRKTFIFPVQLTTSRIGNLPRLILSLATCDDYTYIHTETQDTWVVRKITNDEGGRQAEEH